ncbi:hypothetical protein JCM10207_008257 [Rhodosporidiobolus poonsookiae]
MSHTGPDARRLAVRPPLVHRTSSGPHGLAPHGRALSPFNQHRLPLRPAGPSPGPGLGRHDPNHFVPPRLPHQAFEPPRLRMSTLVAEPGMAHDKQWTGSSRSSASGHSGSGSDVNADPDALGLSSDDDNDGDGDGERPTYATVSLCSTPRRSRRSSVHSDSDLDPGRECTISDDDDNGVGDAGSSASSMLWRHPRGRPRSLRCYGSSSPSPSASPASSRSRSRPCAASPSRSSKLSRSRARERSPGASMYESWATARTSQSQSRSQHGGEWDE